jgi:hypothetical protein
MALSIAPSFTFDGNDGPWSSFNVHLGTPQILLKVLPATSQSTIWAVLEQGCSANTAIDCATSRGGLFDASQSVDISWSPQNKSASQQYFQLPTEAEHWLPDWGVINAAVGYDTVFIDVSPKMKYA